jgi:hypothetical protein
MRDNDSDQILDDGGRCRRIHQIVEYQGNLFKISFVRTISADKKDSDMNYERNKVI